ncbi:MAG: response regulator [Lachnospiraceae bacterium]
MKYNIIIADDEYYIRQKLKKILDLDALDLTLTGDFENGIQVIEHLQKHSVDIALLDIKMPLCSGLDVSKYIHEHHPETQVIILSGYNDFTYAQTTIRYGVFDYLLKPVEETALHDTIKRCITQLNKKQASINKFASLLQYEKKHDLSLVLRESMRYQQFEAKYPDYRGLPYTAFFSYFIESDSTVISSQLVDRYHDAAMIAEAFIESEHIFYLQLFLAEEASISLCHYISQKFFQTISETHFYWFGPLFSVTETWSKYLKSSMDSLDYRYFVPKPNLTTIARVTSENSTPLDLHEIRESLMRLLNTSNIAGFQSYIDSLFDVIREKESPLYLHIIISEIFVTFSIKFSNQENYHALPHDFVSSIVMEEFALEEVKERILNYGMTYMNKIQDIPSDLRLSQSIVDYLLTHYATPDISVSDIAELFGLNSSYVGSVFKKVNNKSILQFLTTLRMTEAKNLLKSNKYKVSEVSEKVGYTDVFYFSKRFKKHFGYSPKEAIIPTAGRE